LKLWCRATLYQHHIDGEDRTLAWTRPNMDRAGLSI
jgi:hypothetical protein